ncbi:OmpA family protein [Alteromonas gracilis]|uniref:OmpA family protein n=1 Tax=Alteromonas gracilis TaxID=1479524 RepID=UPI0030CCD39E
MTSKVPSPENTDRSLDNVRALLIGRDEKFVDEKLKQNAKHYVSDVVSEALITRENKDGSVNKVLVPLVEKSLHRSIEANSDKIVGSLYPLVGTLVRKAFSSFIIEFVERTNTLIENSLSPKSISWRFKAWQSGVKYSEFVAAQIYQYQVQQLLVIHRETGTLLRNVSSDPEKEKDADLISSMLVAINDFVADAFSESQGDAENEIGEIKTGNFTLLIKIGPQAILVAAVTGIVPPDMRRKLQLTLEQFHQFYQTPLTNYDGNNAPFDGAETILSDCLVSEKKEQKKKPKRLVGALLLFAVAAILMVLASLRLSLSILKNDIERLQPPDGILVADTYIDQGKIHTKVLRDPSVTSVDEWLKQNEVDTTRIRIIEEPFASLKPVVVKQKLTQLLNDYPLQDRETLSVNEAASEIAISGQVFSSTAAQLTQQLESIPGIDSLIINTQRLAIVPVVEINDETLQRAALGRLVDKISSQSVLFATNQDTISAVELAKLELLASDISTLEALAIKTNTFISIVVLGASDNSGSSARNKVLSQKRADTVVNTLVSLGVKSELLIAVSLGELPLKKASMGRSVMINVLTSDVK